MKNIEKKSGFVAISELYFKLTEQTEKVITEDEIQLLISNINKSNLSIAFLPRNN